MNRISFETVINFYPEHNAWAYGQLLSAIQDTTTVVPFVGAGLSAFCGYPSWPRVLTKMCGNIRDQSKQEIVRKQIEEGNLIEAAQEILNGYPFFLRRFPEEFSPKLLAECSDAAMRSSAAWMLPYLFPEAPAVTTNFDQVLETVYERSQHRFTDILGPQQLCQRTQARQQRHHALLKLHGSIGKTIDYNAIVFTKEQYDEAYQPDSRLVTELTDIFKNDTLLFLGCSLQMDRTLAVPKKLQSDGSYLTHFAILGCAPDKFDDRSKQLEKLGIIPIFYDDTDPKNHDSVRVVLEHLLYETNPDAYQKLDDEMRRFVGPVKRDDVLMYNAGRIKYEGRTAEMAALERFCSSPVTNEWWAVTGPGGMGKSRLIYEFTNHKQQEGWQILWFSRDQYDQLAALRLPAENTIVVLDDVQADTQTAGEWLNAMRNHRRINRLRILMIEREGTDYASADWLRVLRNGTPYNDPLAVWCYNKTFLHLEPLTDDDLKKIMSSCAETLEKSIDPDSLLAALDQVDGELRRPLYALAIAEATCNGDDPLHWDPKRVLDEMLNRELDFHYESLQYILKEQPTTSLQEDLEKLMAQCCIYSHLNLEKATAEEYPFLTQCMARMSTTEFFRCLGLLHIEDGKPVLKMNCPDLIKEHLVLRLAFEQNTVQLLPDGWYLEPDRLIFLHRLWLNYSDRLKDQTAFWDQFFSAPPASGLPARLYADLLWGCTAIFSPLAQRATDTLNKLHLANPGDETIAMCYAKGLVNLSAVQSPEDRAATVDRLEKLYHDHSGSDEVAVEYANGLYNLTCVQSPEECVATVDRLQKLYHDHSGSDEVAVRYANGLYNLTCDQSPEDCVAAVDRLEKLYHDHSGSDEVAVAYADGLYNLTCVQSPEDRADTVDRLEKLYHDHSGNDEVAVAYAQCLYNLTCVQSPEDRVAAVDRLEKLYHDHSGNDKVAVEYAVGLFNLSNSQSPEDRVAAVDRLEKLYHDHSGNDKVAVEYAVGLFNLSNSQSPEDRAATMDRLEKLYHDHSGSDEVAVRYAKGLVNLSAVQSPEDCAATVVRLEKLYHDHSSNDEVGVEYAKGLYNLTCVQSPEDCATTLDRLEKLYNDHSGSDEVAVEYANGLHNLTCVQSLEDRAATLVRLERLYHDHSGSDEVAAQYAGGLVNLALSQTEEADVRRTLARSRAVLDLHSDHADIRLSHAMTWFNLTLVQQEASIAATVSEIAAFLKAHPDAIPGFKKALVEYLSKHPDHADRYRPLSELGGDSHAK